MQLETFFPYQLAVAAEGFSRQLVEVYGHEFGLSREEWRMLLLLADAEELTSRELAQRTTLDKVQISRAAQKLEDKDLITRAVSKEDRRLKVYKCTDQGHALFGQALPQVQARAEQMLKSLTHDERVALDAGLAALSRVINDPNSCL